MSRSDRGSTAARVAVVLLPAFFGAHSAEAQAPDFRLRFGAGTSDNVRRDVFVPESGTYRALGFIVSSQREGERLQTDIDGDIEYREYSLDTVDNEPVGYINALVGVEIVPERFRWEFEESYGEGRVNQFIPIAPGNRQGVNMFATGPRVTLPLGARTSLLINGEHQRRRFKSTPQLDNDSDEVLLGLSRAVSPTTDLSLSWTTRDITSDFAVSTWEDESVYFTYQRRLATGSAEVNLGENKVRLGGVERSGPLFDVAWTRGVGARSTLDISAQLDFVDPGDRFAFTNAVVNVGPGAPPPTDILLGAGVYELRSFSVNNSTELERTTFSFGASVSESDYQTNVSFNNESRGLNAAVNTLVTERLTIGLQTSVFETDLPQLGRVDEDRWTQLNLRRQMGRRLELQFSYLHDTRDSQGVAAVAYEENQYQLTLLLDLNP